MFAYQWQRCDAAGAGCAPIVGATAETYLPATDDVGHALTVAVTAQSTIGTASATSPPTPAISSSGSTVTRPTATSPPTVNGTPQAGQTLSLTVGLWTGSPTAFTYQWRRCSAVGTQCVAVVGAAASTYTLTPDDIGATISPVVTATGRGGSTSAPAQTTATVAAAPLPAAVPGSAVAVAGSAGAVSTADGSATVTWQPGAVPAGSTVSLTTSGRGLRLDVSPTLAQLPWPVDIAYAAPTTGIVGTSTDDKVWHVAPHLLTPALPVAQLTGTYADGAGLTHILLRTTGRVALFVPGSWGDPSLVAAGPPKPRLVGTLHAKRLHNGVVVVTARVRLPSQALVLVNIPGKTSVKRSQARRPGIVPVSVSVSGRRLPRGTPASLRVAARDPYGRSAAASWPASAPRRLARVDLVVRNARLLDGRLVDLAAEDGRWSRIGESLGVDAAHELDAEARLVTAPLVDCHLHLDASLTAGKPRWNESGTLIEGIHVWGELKPSLTEQDVFERAREIVRWSVAQGTLFIRAHADVSGENEAMVRGLLRVRDELADLCTVQVTAFPQDGIFARDGDEERLENALRLGVDCVGGIPHYEPTSELGLKEVHRVFELAKQYSRRIDVHCDETDDPSSRFLEVMADDTVKFGLAGRVTASHCTAMGSYEPYYSSKLHGFLQARRDQHRRQPVCELAHPGTTRRLSEAARLRAAEGAARRRRQRLARKRRDHGSRGTSWAVPTWSRPLRSRCTSRT